MEVKKTRCYKNMNGDVVIAVVEAPKSFENQIILYAKGWYKKSVYGILADLKTLLSEYAGVDASLNDVKQILCSTFANYCPEYYRGKAIQEMLGWYGWDSELSRRTPAEIMIGSISCCEGKYCDTDELLPVLQYEEDEKTPIQIERDELYKHEKFLLDKSEVFC
jgi:hypothetical protein